MTYNVLSGMLNPTYSRASDAVQQAWRKVMATIVINRN